jgi:hypothetical protein
MWLRPIKRRKGRHGAASVWRAGHIVHNDHPTDKRQRDRVAEAEGTEAQEQSREARLVCCVLRILADIDDY